MKFKQICNHPSQYLGNNEYKTEQSGKFARLQEICEEIASRQEKVLLFTQFREITLPLESLLQEIFNRQGLILHGGTPVKQRKNLVDSFQKEQGHSESFLYCKPIFLSNFFYILLIEL